MHNTIRLFVGTSPGGEDYEAEAVLEWSARKHCSLPLEIVWMRQAKKGPYAGWNCSTGRTPFSHFRWSIPAMCDFVGRGIYCDVDFVFRGDLADLWREDIPAILVTKPGAADCILFDNAKCKGHIPSLEELKRLSDPNGHVTKYLKAHQELVTAYTSGNWNHKTGKNTTPDLGCFSPQTKAVHYTRIENQLHLKHALKRLSKKGHWYTGPTFAHPTPDLQTLFDDLLVEAQANGFTYESYQYGSDVKLVRSDFTYKNHRGLCA